MMRFSFLLFCSAQNSPIDIQCLQIDWLLAQVLQSFASTFPKRRRVFVCCESIGRCVSNSFRMEKLSIKRSFNVSFELLPSRGCQLGIAWNSHLEWKLCWKSQIFLSHFCREQFVELFRCRWMPCDRLKLTPRWCNSAFELCPTIQCQRVCSAIVGQLENGMSAMGHSHIFN